MAKGTLAAGLGLSLCILTACGSTAAHTPATAPGSAGGHGGAAATAAHPLTHVTLRLPWIVAGQDAPFYLAQEDGAYKAAGLDVAIEPSTSSLVTAETVANGKDTFGFADATAVAGVISRGGQEKMIAQVVDDSPVGIIHRANLALRTPKDLVGRTILTNSSGGPVVGLLDAALAAGHVAKSSVHLNIVAPSAEAASFAAHNGDLLAGFCDSTFLAAKALVPTAVCTTDSQIAPIKVLSLGLVTSTAEIKAHPNVVRKFLAATIKAWQQAMKNESQILAPSLQEAKALHQSVPSATTWKLGLDQTLVYLHQPAGKPFGYETTGMWASTLRVLHLYAGLKKPLPPADYFTNSFLPS